LPKLTSLDLGENQLVSLELPPGMTNLQGLFLADNQLTNLSLPPALSALTTLVLANNQITTLTLPAGLTSLTTLVLSGNPLTTLALSQQEATNLAQTVAALRAQGVSIVIFSNSNSPPTVAITSPTNGASFIAPATITIQAAASDSDGSVTNVQFFDGNTSLGNVSSSPYNLSVSLGVGSHPLIVVASDNRGGTTAALVTVTVNTNTPPTVAITSPANGASFIAPATFTIQAAATDSDGSVTNVQFFDGDTSLGNVSSSPFNLSATLGVGSHALSAVATDNRGAKTTTLPVTVTVTTNTPPTVAITSPTNGTSFIAPATITIQAAASDTDGSVTNVQFFDGTNSLGNVPSSPYNLSVSLAVGSHALIAIASDNLGVTTTTLPATVTVTTNTPPTDVSIPDPGLNAAVRQALQKPAGTLTVEDLLSLTNLDGRGRNIRSLKGLEAASNLVSLNLQSNQLSNFSDQFTNLTVLDLSLNSLTNCSFPGGLMKLAALNLEGNLLTSLTLPAGLNGLSSLELSGNRFTSFDLPSNLTSLTFFDLSFNPLTNVSLPSGLTNLTKLVIRANNVLTNLELPESLTALETLDIDNNLLEQVSLPADMKSLIRLNLEGNQLKSLTLPVGMTNLAALFLDRNHLDSLTLPADLTKLAFLDLTGNFCRDLTLPGSLTALTELHLPINLFSSFTLPGGLTNLTTLDLFENALTNFTLPAGLTALTNLNLAVNQFTSFTVPPDATNLSTLFLHFNQSLTNLTLVPGMNNLIEISLSGDRLANLALPPGLTNLSVLDLTGNRLTDLTLPLDVTNLTTLLLDGNPLRTLTLSQQLATTNLAALVASLRNQGISVVILQTTTNSPPTVAITSPTNGASFTAPATITIQAAASDSDGSITNVQFFDGANSLGNASSSPYELSVSLAVASHTLTAVAYDNLGATTTSLAVTVTVTTNSPPTVTAIVISGVTKLPDGSFQLAFTNGPGARFTVLTSTNLALPVDEWTSAGAAQETSPGSYQFTDETTSSSQLFYRIRSP
jgi:Leucine-rich repeat (LRR) protein